MTTIPSLNLAELRVRPAIAIDRPRLILLINAAYTLEAFFDGTRTDEVRLAAMMSKGKILLAEESSGQLLGCVYTEVRGPRGYLGQLAVDPAHQGAGLGRLLVQAAEEYLRSQGCEIADLLVLSLRPELPPSIASSATSRPEPSSSIPPAR